VDRAAAAGRRPVPATPHDPRRADFGRPLPFTGSLLLNLLLLGALFQVLTGRRVAWRRLLPGATFGAVGWSVLQALGVYVLDRQLEQANLITACSRW
jgi:uncharacterized BrkB/YihY/UPF0761 family membrane protein